MDFGLFQLSGELGDGGKRPDVLDGPAEGWHEVLHVLFAQVKDRGIPFRTQLLNQDLPVCVPDRDPGRGRGGAPHLGALTHGGRLNHIDVIFKHLGGGTRYQVTMTGVPTSTLPYRSSESGMCILMQPCDAYVPIEESA